MSSFMATFTTPRLVGPPLHLYGYMYLTAFFYLLGILLVVLIPETKVWLKNNKLSFKNIGGRHDMFCKNK